MLRMTRVLELMAKGMRWCNVEFLDADVEKGGRELKLRLLTGGNVVVSGLHESHTDNVSTVPRNPMCRRRSVLCGAVGRAGVFESNQITNDERVKHTREKTLVFFFQAVGVHKDAREVRERRR